MKSALEYRMNRSVLTLFQRKNGLQPFCQYCQKSIAEGEIVIRKVRRRGCGAKRKPACVYWHRSCFEKLLH